MTLKGNLFTIMPVIWNSSVLQQKLFYCYCSRLSLICPSFPSFLLSSLSSFLLPSLQTCANWDTAGPKQADGLQAEGDVQAAWPKGITTHLFRPGSILGLAPSLAQSQVPPVSLPNCGLSVLFLTELAHVVLHTQSVFSVGLFFFCFFF